LIGAAPAAAEQKEFADPAGRTRWAHDFGAVGDGEHDDTAALAHGLEWASKNRGVLLLDPGFYAIRSLEIGSQATLRAVAAGGSRFGRDGRQIPAVLVPILGRIDTRPLVTITGTGARLEGVGVTGYNFRQGGDPDDPRGWSTSPGVVVTGGVEVFLADVRVFRVANAGIRVEQLNNARWRDVSIDDCGTIEVPAMRIESVECTNYVTFDGLTIERSANTALDIATGSDPVRDWASNLHFSGLHIESNADGASQHGLNTAPLIDIGNVRAVTLIAPQLLGRPVPLIRYRQRISQDAELPARPGGDARDQQGGLQIVGGHIKQHGGGDPGSRVASIEVDGNGRGTAVVAVKFDSLWCPGVRVRESYQHDVLVQACTFRRASVEVGYPASVQDDRPATVQRSAPARLHGWQQLIGGSLTLDDGSLHVERGAVHLAGKGLVMQATTASSKTAFSAEPPVYGGWVSPSQGAGTDNIGRVWCRVDADVTGALFTVVFEDVREEAPVVSVTPRNASAARANVYVDAVLDGGGAAIGFTVHATQAVSTQSGVMFFDYVVVGRAR
jgi:hypothetical protein